MSTRDYGYQVRRHIVVNQCAEPGCAAEITIEVPVDTGGRPALGDEPCPVCGSATVGVATYPADGAAGAAKVSRTVYRTAVVLGSIVRIDRPYTYGGG
jgi:hypothetical protein